MLSILLNTGAEAIVDYEDAWAVRYMWQEVAGRSTTYASRNLPGGGSSLLHREIMNVSGSSKVDHEDGNGLNCRRSNLRVVSNQENLRNVEGASKNSTSGYLGVAHHRRTGRWRAHITVDRKQRHLGLFDSAAEANRARLLAEKAIFGVQPRRRQAFADAGITL